MRRPSFILLNGLLAMLASTGCDSLAKIDVDCKRLCLDAPGPTVPALSNPWPSAINAALASWDGGVKGIDDLTGLLDGAAIDASPSAFTGTWGAQLAFNEVLAQLPSAAAGLSADVRLASVALRSTTDLDFIESVEVTMSHETVSKPSAKSANAVDGGVAGGVAGGVDGGIDGGTDCRGAGFVVRVAYFRRIEGASNGRTINLTMVAPDMNLFDCMKDAPTRFSIELSPHLGSVSAVDAPLTLGTCIGAATHLRFP
jgi:hypothetical protein